jgi:hypothetical protein
MRIKIYWKKDFNKYEIIFVLGGTPYMIFTCLWIKLDNVN